LIVTRPRNLDQADALLFGRVTYEMMEAAFRRRRGRERDLIGWNPSPTIDAAKYVVEHPDRVGGTQIVRGGSGEGRSTAQAGVG
jgi:hypothetical protein